MDARPKVPSEVVHDATLIEWFLSLTPAERLAELESRLAFFNSARPNDDIKLPPDPYLTAAAPTLLVGELPVRVLNLATLIEEKKTLGRAKDRAVIALLESVLRGRGGR